MSLVELALKKMQSRSVAEPRPATDPATASRVPPGVIDESVHARAPGLPEPRGPRHRTDILIRIDKQGLRTQQLLPPEHQERAIADQYRQIKRPLIANAIGQDGVLPKGQLILVASGMPGEGKTFTSINLALNLALEKDLSVLLVDADVAKPHISRIFGVAEEPGLLDLLRDDGAAVESFIAPTDIPSLSILPAGRRSETDTELIASRRMDVIAQQLMEQDASRLVVIDSPPLLMTSESRALVRAVGQIVLVVRAEFTPQQAVLDTIDFIDEGKFIGLVLNQSREAPSGYYYGQSPQEAAART